MPYTFTTLEQQELTTAFNLGPSVSGQAGTHQAFYAKIVEILTTDNGSSRPDADLDVLPVRIWAQGATKSNSGIGVFSTLIRESTNKQGELHWLRQFRKSEDPNVVGEIQDASNEIARKIFDDLNISNWKVSANQTTP